MAKKKQDTIKKITIFDFLRNLTSNKVKWETYSESERKLFSPFMINKWLSMNYYLTELVNELQKYTIGLLTSREVYNLYLGILPKQKLFYEYIKSEKQEKYDSELLHIFSMYFKISKKQATEYIDIMGNTLDGLEEIRDILKKYGFDDKKINKLTKNV